MIVRVRHVTQRPDAPEDEREVTVDLELQLHSAGHLVAVTPTVHIDGSDGLRFQAGPNATIWISIGHGAQAREWHGITVTKESEHG